MDGFRVDPAALTPPAVQIVEAVLDAIARGLYAAGDRLPSQRKLAVEVLVNHNTAAKAYADLAGLGVVVARNGSGIYVAPDGPERARDLRRAATLAALHDAVRAAVRAGLPPAAVRAAVEACLEACREQCRGECRGKCAGQAARAAQGVSGPGPSNGGGE